MKLLLASQSPRRKQLLEACHFELDLLPAGIDESWDSGVHPRLHALGLAREKANVGPPDRLVVAADTVVHYEDILFDKPRDRTEAASHLRRLSGNWHTVSTAVCVRFNELFWVKIVDTQVRFRVLSETEICRYLETGEGDDKAGAYAIQGIGGVLIAEVVGSWTNVMGLPIEETLQGIQEITAASSENSA